MQAIALIITADIVGPDIRTIDKHRHRPPKTQSPSNPDPLHPEESTPMTTPNLSADVEESLRAYVDNANLIVADTPAIMEDRLSIWRSNIDSHDRGQASYDLSQLFSIDAAIINALDRPSQQSIKTLEVVAEAMSIPELTERIGDMLASHLQIFRTFSSRTMATVWFATAVTPGDSDIALSAVRTDWEQACQRLREERGNRHISHFNASDLTHNPQITQRTDVKVNGRKVKGWSGVNYDTESAYQAIRFRADLSAAGTRIMQTKSFPDLG